MAPTPVTPAVPRSGIRNLDELGLAHQRVLVRTDFDVPLTATGGVADDRKLRLALPTLRKALDEGARVVVATHASSESGTAPSLEPIAGKLAELLGQEVYLPDACVGDAARKVVGDLREGQLCLLENLDWAAEERAGEEGFARKLATLCDVFVNEALACSLEPRASLVALPRLLKEKGAGLRLAAELEALGRAAVTAQKPFVGILGGAGLQHNLQVFELMARRCDVICVAGVLASTLLAAKELDMKSSLVEREQLALARSLLARARDQKLELILPVDVLAATSPEAAEGRAVSVGSLPDLHAALDIGPKTLELFCSRLRDAKTVLLHGALGKLEQPAFAEGSRGVLRALGEASAFGVVTGSALGALALREGPELEGKIGLISTGGMASLAVIEGKKLPGVEALRT
jgi:phosphoglycerate kinase